MKIGMITDSLGSLSFDEMLAASGGAWPGDAWSLPAETGPRRRILILTRDAG